MSVVVAHLAVVLPGGNNDPWTPPVLLPCPRVEQKGPTVERISYGQPSARGRGLRESAEFNAAVADQVAGVVERHQPDKVTFVSKSRGTLFLAAMDKAVVAACTVDATWVTTPLVGLDYVRDGILDKSDRELT